MPDGRLWHLRDTYPIETAWAPRYVGDELRQVRAAAWDARLSGSGELSGSLAEHSKVPQQGVAALAVSFQLADGDAGSQLVSLLGRIDHLGEQEDVTLHRQAEPQPGLTVSASDAGRAGTLDPPDGRTSQ
jgi:hypothetical protein